MTRRKRKIWIPKDAQKIKGILLFMLRTHPAGLAVLSGTLPFPSLDELAEMTTLSSPAPGTSIKGGLQDFLTTLDGHGGATRLAEVIAEYARAYPEKYGILQEVGNRGKLNAKSLETIAGEHHVDPKTLRNLRDKIIEEIAMAVVFQGENFSLFK